MPEATLSSKYQIVVPKDARKALRVKAGDKLLIVLHDNCLLVMPKPKSFAKALRGSMRGVYPKDYLRKERASWD
jgi:AbrB family looped-hinge helix DNA binding protein